MAGDNAGGLDTPEKYAEFALTCKQLGYHGFKIHVATGATLAEMSATVRLVRRAIGPDMRLMVDPAGKLSSWLDAWTLGKVCDEEGVAWLEDPYGPQSVASYGYQRLRDKIATPLLVSEHIRGVQQHATAVLGGSTDLVRIDIEQDGGFTGALKIAHFAEALGLDVEIHRAGPAQRHLLSALGNSNYYEMGLLHPLTGTTGLPDMIYADRYSDGLYSVDALGCVAVPEGPGLGVVYDDRVIEAAAVERFTS
jgi:L-alanine-DL-glutamate epimerase-like enolase superfamily enzyme